MNKVFGSLVVQFRDYFKNLGPTKRMSVTVASVVAMVALAVMTVMVSGKDYVTLLSNVPTDQVASIIEKLNQKIFHFNCVMMEKLWLFRRIYFIPRKCH